MTRPYSRDLRERAIARVVAGVYTYDIPLTVTAFEAGLRRL
jgi:hypothetical protein